MNKTRVNSIKELFEGVGPNNTTLYTNQEIVDLLQEIQKTMIAGIYEKTHAEYMREKDLMIHFSTLAAEYGLKETETYKRFEKNMNELGYTIGTFIKGLKGERIAKKALKLISFDKNVKILYNVALEDEDVQAEYDAIVITPYGLFVVEVKNWGSEIQISENGILRRKDQEFKYDLPGRMSVKEGLLREYLGELFPELYQGIVLFSNENANVRDNYKQIPICYGGGIVYSIRAFNKEEILSASEISKIARIITSNHKEQKTLCKVNCEEIINDYAVLMAAIEEASEGTYSSVKELINAGGGDGDVTQRNEKMKRGFLHFFTKGDEEKEQIIRKVLVGSMKVAAGFGLGMATARTITRYK